MDISKLVKEKTQFKSLINSIENAVDFEERICLLMKLSDEIMLSSPEEALKLTREAYNLARRSSVLSAQARSLNQIGTIYWHLSNFREAIKSHSRALITWELLDNKEGIGKSHNGIGNAYLKIGSYDIAQKHYIKALRILEPIDDKKGIASLYNNLGIIHKNKGNYNLALDYYLNSLKIKEEINVGPKGIGHSYTNIGLLFFYQKNDEKALDYLSKAKEIHEKQNDLFALATVYNNFGFIYEEQGNPELALHYLDMALEMKTELGDKMGIIFSLQEIGKIHQLLENYPKTIETYTKALDLSREVGSKSAEADIYTLIGKMYFQREDYEEALVHLQSGFELRTELDSIVYLSESYHLVAKCHAKTGRFDKAYQYEAMFNNVKEDLFNEEKTRIINELEAKYRMEKKDLKIEKLRIRQELLEESNRELEMFAGRAAHDMAEPLRMVSSYSTLIDRRCGNLLTDEGREFLGIIKDASGRMNHLLHSLLNYAKSDIKNIKLDPINLTAVMVEVKSNLRLAIAEKKALIIHDELPVVKATHIHMVQLFQNLISNALKFCEEKPEIRIGFKQEGNAYLISVKDNGIGISKDNLKSVFEVFSRVHTRTKYPGSGVGLATCKKIVESLGKKIWLDSEPGEGTTFYFLLPRI